ncbi:haloacid dehalogenase-like hydrolase [Peptoniphilus sp. GNH]|nr:hypothetical protein HMPREF3189_00706 [Clostridiales bacterium KA00134]UHR02821.1 haloacid dehalogenase-like hydrolase [Peptoniphilus sp. GNH]
MKAALFDFDKTLTDKDSIVYLVKLAFKKKPLQMFWLSCKLILLGLFRIKDELGLKEQLYSCLSYFSEDEFREFAKYLIDKHTYRDGIFCLKKLKDEGYFLILSSASAYEYIKYIKDFLPFDICIGTFSKAGKIVHNNKHQNKVEKLKEVLGPSYEDYEFEKAYSDSYKADKPLLDLAKERYLINSKLKISGYTNLWWQ